MLPAAPYFYSPLLVALLAMSGALRGTAGEGAARRERSQKKCSILSSLEGGLKEGGREGDFT